jgi:hypothetical protein
MSPKDNDPLKLKGKFLTRAGRLTPYALTCGYQEQRTCELITDGVKEEVELTLWQECPGLRSYHVKAVVLRYSEYLKCDLVDRRLFWESFPTIGEARRCFDRHPATTLKRLKELSESQTSATVP